MRRASSATSSPRKFSSHGTAGTPSAHSRSCATRRNVTRGARSIPAHPVLIAAELQPLLEPADLVGLPVTWLAADQPTPAGPYVASVPPLPPRVRGPDL